MRLAMSLPSSGFTGSWVSYIESQLKFQWLCVDIYLLRGCVSFNTKTNPPKYKTCFILASSLRVCSSFLRSFLLPTRMIGTLGQKCFTSGVHFSGMFSKRIKKNPIYENQSISFVPDLFPPVRTVTSFPCDCAQKNTKRSLRASVTHTVDKTSDFSLNRDYILC